MVTFTISEQLLITRMFTVEAMSMHEALALFHNGEATFLGMDPDGNRPLVTTFVIAPDGTSKTEDELDVDALCDAVDNLDPVPPAFVLDEQALAALEAVADDPEGDDQVPEDGKVILVHGESTYVPGRTTLVAATKEAADEQAARLVNLIRDELELPADATAADWAAKCLEAREARAEELGKTLDDLENSDCGDVWLEPVDLHGAISFNPRPTTGKAI